MGNPPFFSDVFPIKTVGIYSIAMFVYRRVLQKVDIQIKPQASGLGRLPVEVTSILGRSLDVKKTEGSKGYHFLKKKSAMVRTVQGIAKINNKQTNKQTNKQNKHVFF